MGTSQADKEKHHERIVGVAAKMVREKGMDGISIADLMKDAGLTHGGFYRHFGAREDLVSEAVECALTQWIQQLKRDPKVTPAKRLQSVIGEYLSIAHCNSPGSGCAVAALSSEAWRGGKRVRQAYTRQVKLYLSLIEAALDSRRPPLAKRDSMLVLSALVGAVSMARSVDDAQLSRDILKGTAEALKSFLTRT